MSLSRLRMGRRSTCDPGRNAFTPPRMVTERPPFTRWLMVPSDRKSTRLNSSHSQISYAVFCLKKKNNVHAGPNATSALRLTAHQRNREHFCWTRAVYVFRAGAAARRSSSYGEEDAVWVDSAGG